MKIVYEGSGQIAMDKKEALITLKEQLDGFENMGRDALSKLIGEDKAFEVPEMSGRPYQIELSILWDDKPNGAILILGSVDDGGLRAFLPLTESRLVLPSSG